MNWYPGMNWYTTTLQQFSLVYNNLCVFLEPVDEPRPTYACGQLMQGSSIPGSSTLHQCHLGDGSFVKKVLCNEVTLFQSKQKRESNRNYPSVNDTAWNFQHNFKSFVPRFDTGQK